MARGVNEQFLRILDMERRRAWRGLALGVGAATVLLFIAELADTPRFGDVVVTYALAWVLGALGGVLIGYIRDRRHSEALRNNWTAWMRSATGSVSLREIRAKVGKRTPLPAGLWGILVVAVGALNGVLFAFLWFNHPQATMLAAWTCVVNGIIVGAWFGATAWRLGWSTRFARALDDLLKEGVVGIWGER